MEGFKRWIALLATITLLLLSLMSGLISAAPGKEWKDKEAEQSDAAEETAEDEVPGSEGTAGDPDSGGSDISGEDENLAEPEEKQPGSVDSGHENIVTQKPAPVASGDAEDPEPRNDDLASLNTTMSLNGNPELRDPWQSGNAEFECGQAGCGAKYAYKVDAPAPNGNYNHAGNTITISNSDSFTFDWTSAYPVSCVIVVGGSMANIFRYSGGSYGDTGLYAPLNPNTAQDPDDTFQISHVTFCFNGPDEEEPGSICGTKWEDLNCNGRHNRGEPPLEGITIELYDAAGKFVASSVTDKDGKYCFINLPLGKYTVKEVLSKEWYATNPMSGERTVWLKCSKPKVCGVDFLNARYGRVHGYKFLDANCNGVMDEGEKGIPDVRVKLWSIYGPQETWTDTNGYYSFEGLKPGFYKVILDTSTVPEGHYHTTATWELFWLCCSGEERFDFGNGAYGMIEGYKFLDANCNGVMDEGEEGIEGVKVKLWSKCSGWKATTTDADGHYSFTGLKPGKYLVVLDKSTVPEGHYHTTAIKAWVDLGCSGEERVDFGNAVYGSICGTKWEDLNGNGGPDEGEPPVEGVTVELWMKTETNGDVEVSSQIVNGAGWAYLTKTETDSNGSYCFYDLKPGQYKVKEVLSEEQAEEWYFKAPETGELEVTLKCGDNVEGIDFLNCRRGSITGYKYTDMNGDGILDEEERDHGFEGVEIKLLTQDDPPVLVKTTETDADGKFAFTDVEPGIYDLEEVLDGDVYNSAPINITGVMVISGEETVLDEGEGQYFLNYRRGSITGYKLLDLGTVGVPDESDEFWNGAETPIEIELLLNGALIDTFTIRDESGVFFFGDLDPGTYVVREGELPERVTSAVDNEITVTVRSGEDVILDREDYFLNYFEAEVAPIIITPEQPSVGPEVTPQPQTQLPATGLNQLPLMLAAAALMLMGLIALMLGMIRSLRS